MMISLGIAILFLKKELHRLVRKLVDGEGNGGAWAYAVDTLEITLSYWPGTSHFEAVDVVMEADSVRKNAKQLFKDIQSEIFLVRECSFC